MLSSHPRCKRRVGRILLRFALLPRDPFRLHLVVDLLDLFVLCLHGRELLPH